MENQEIINEEKGNDVNHVLATVPYQLCPKCGGDGKVLVQNWYGSPTSISSGVETCNLCGGAMIIPMHIVPTEYKIQG